MMHIYKASKLQIVSSARLIRCVLKGSLGNACVYYIIQREVLWLNKHPKCF